MDANKEIELRLKAVLGDLHVQLIVAQVNLEAAQARIRGLEAELLTARPQDAAPLS